MAAAYAALVSVMHIIDEIQNHHRLPISLEKEQVESLTENISFLQEFLEEYFEISEEAADGLENRITDAACAAEHVIESHIADGILHEERIRSDVGIDSIELNQGLQKVIEDMDLIKKEVMEIKETTGVQRQLHRDSSVSAASLRSSFPGQNIIMAGLDGVLNEVMDKLTGLQYNLQIIPIVGMGGIGKTTLARNVYTNPLIVQHFHTLAWVTISPEYSPQEILLQFLLCQKDKYSVKDLEDICKKNEDKLGEILYKDLSGMRYLIVMDDIWSIDAWDKVKIFFPNNNGSRIIITTRISCLAFELSGSHGFLMSFLDEDQSWNLLCKRVFGEEDCPSELEEIGKMIAKNCRGLPLLIVVIGGLLTTSKKIQEHWEYTLKSLSPIINLEDNELCTEILYLSYKELPIHLKPCFLSVGIFPEDSEIRVSELYKLWVAMGFLKPIDGKILEEVAEEYLNQLIDRNLILVDKWGSSGKIKFCKIHDLFRDICLREVDKQKFRCVMKQLSFSISRARITRRQSGIRGMLKLKSREEFLSQVLHASKDAPLANSLVVDFAALLHVRRSFSTEIEEDYFKRFSQSVELILYNMNENIAQGLHNKSFQDSMFKLFHFRYLSCPNMGHSIPYSVYYLWNLQTLIAKHTSAIAPCEFWKMPLIRHVEFDTIYLPDPPGRDDDFVLGSLQTLFKIRIWDCREKVVERIPNIKKLKIRQGEFERQSVGCLNNLAHLHKLENLHCSFIEKGIRSELLQNLTFPHSLKKLTLHGCRFHWEDMAAKIGSLPVLEVLKLKWRSFIGSEWETVEGKFCSLKFLLIEGCGHLKYWRTDNAHFPRLEHLRLRCLDKLKEIPTGIGEIPTLQSIHLDYCSHSAIRSAERILEEQKELGNEGIQLRLAASEDYNVHLPGEQLSNIRASI